MSGSLLVTLPLQLVCQLISPGNHDYGNVTFVEDTTTLIQQTALPSGYTAFLDIGVAYKYYANRMTWNDARKQCIAEGGNLAVIDSFKKVEYVMSVKDRSANIHTGLHRLYNNVEWINVKTNQALAFIPWKPEVNLASNTGGCVALWYDGSGLSPWTCTSVLPAVCEIPVFEAYRNKAEVCRNKTGDNQSQKNPQLSFDVRVLTNPNSNVPLTQASLS